MLKKLILILGLGIGGSVAGLVFGQSQAFACSNGVCGYYNNGNDSAWCNVLPDPSIYFSWSTNNCWKSSTTPYGHSTLYGDNSTGSFTTDIKNYLWQTGSNSGFVNNAQTGAAFLIDDMLGLDYHNYNTGAGINDARAHYAEWVSIVNALGANQCSISTQPTCPGKSFGINWAYTPPYFCNSPANTSAYDPWAHDAVIYTTVSWTCDHDWRASTPEIVLYWNNGANSFHIGSQCGNAQSHNDTLPVNHLPSGTITVSCVDPNTGLQNAHITFSDLDAATTGKVAVNGWSAAYTSSGAGKTAVYDVRLPAPPTTDPYTKQTVSLIVQDTGPLAPANSWYTWTTQSAAPCATVGCSISSPTPDVVDPSTKFSITITATTSVGTLPGTARLQLKVTPPAGNTYSYSSTPQSLSGNSVTFGGLGPTLQVGVYTLTGTLTGVGSTQTCTGSVSVVYMPYLNVYGGDVMTGSSPSYTGGQIACDTEPNAGVFSWNNDNRNGLGYAGAGAQYAVQVLGDLTSSSGTAGQIEDFASDLDPANTAPISPVNLSFANTAPMRNQPTNGLFGGAFGAASNVCDFTSDIKPTANADTILSATTVSPNTSKVVYVTNHDVYISGNIVYGYDAAAPGGWTSISRIPSFRLVVTGGDIYISSNVTKLDGLYVAESIGNSGGRIFTCATGLRLSVDPTLPNSYTTCNKQLVIDGAFVAKFVAFGRTYGSLGQAKITDNLTTNHDAEVFNYTPELWLPRNASAPDGGYASITGLPPVL